MMAPLVVPTQTKPPPTFSPSNHAGFKSGELLNAFAVDPLVSAVTFIKDPDRPLSLCEGGWSRPKFQQSQQSGWCRWVNAANSSFPVPATQMEPKATRTS